MEASWSCSGWRNTGTVTFERLSTGLKQRLALAKALINDPELLFLDEPTSGLDQEMAQHIREEILRLNRETGVTMLLTTHNLREAEMLCTEVAFLKEGQLISEGRIPELQKRLGLGDHLSLIFQDSPGPAGLWPPARGAPPHGAGLPGGPGAGPGGRPAAGYPGSRVLRPKEAGPGIGQARGPGRNLP